MKRLAGIVAALALVGVPGAYGQSVDPGPAYSYPGAPYASQVAVPSPVLPMGVAPGPYDAAYIPGPYPGSVVVNPYTGRWCTLQPDGWHWCWTP